MDQRQMDATTPRNAPCPAQSRVLQRLFLSRSSHGTAALQPARHSLTLWAGESADRDALFLQFTPLVNRLLRKFGDDSEVRRDLVAEIYCRFVNFLNAYDPERGVPLRPYLVNNLTISVFNYARSYRRRKRREQSLEEQQLPLTVKQATDPTPTWDRMIAEERDKRMLAAALLRLSERQRSVVIWRFYDELPFAEIARRLRIREATARSTLRKALHNLRQWLVDGGFLD